MFQQQQEEYGVHQKGLGCKIWPDFLMFIKEYDSEINDLKTQKVYDLNSTIIPSCTILIVVVVFISQFVSQLLGLSDQFYCSEISLLLVFKQMDGTILLLFG
eukprot:TRINITY_DN2103_c0_g1_i3.p6 TRINITY_DN2103_c0_g1~~TRINITY_DN2103_c0_g1_i3.p6  ORF type:complete len:102 (-),score=0.44 TRINITY_DN2103_c0_g1_i3:187-492(-)